MISQDEPAPELPLDSNKYDAELLAERGIAFQFTEKTTEGSA